MHLLSFQIVPSCSLTPIVPQSYKDLQFIDPTTFSLTLISPYLLFLHLRLHVES